MVLVWATKFLCLSCLFVTCRFFRHPTTTHTHSHGHTLPSAKVAFSFLSISLSLSLCTGFFIPNITTNFVSFVADASCYWSFLYLYVCIRFGWDFLLLLWLLLLSRYVKVASVCLNYMNNLYVVSMRICHNTIDWYDQYIENLIIPSNMCLVLIIFRLFFFLHRHPFALFPRTWTLRVARLDIQPQSIGVFLSLSLSFEHSTWQVLRCIKRSNQTKRRRRKNRKLYVEH